MRLTLRLGALTPILALTFLGFTETVLLAQTPKIDSPKTPFSAPVDSNAVPSIVVPQSTPFGSDGGRPASVEASPIRERYLELSKKKAYALDEEQLKREVDAMETDVRELEAWAKASEAVRLLQEVVNKHPNTEAADAAQVAIRQIENRRKQAITDLGPKPRPDRPIRRGERVFERSDERFEAGPAVPPARNK